MRRYTVMLESQIVVTEWEVCKRWTRWGMMRTINRYNGRVAGLPLRFFGKIGG